MEKVKDVLPKKIEANPKNVEKGLAKLVLTLIELIRKLLEKQAMRRVEGGSLTEEEIERVGETLMKLEDKMKELKEIFGLKDEELNLDLGPLGDLM
ncbi:MAG: gas vesicle protein K [candidate division Zixibacteria bacterium]|nr:gas vesicle protein K [candidate division Zixibacteria bacterium]